MLFFEVGKCNSDFDYCDGDPRIRTVEHNCPGNKHVIHMRRTWGNPNHALHDYLWALSYYINNCARGAVTLLLPDVPLNNIEQCTNRTHDHKKTSPYWSICVIDAMLKKLGPQHSYKFIKSESFLNSTEKICYRTETRVGLLPKENGYYGKHLADHFRILNYYGRNMSMNQGKPYNMSALKPLALTAKKEAFYFIRDAIYEKYDINPERRGLVWNKTAGDDKIRVLVYNRHNVVRRRWVNAEVVTRRLDKMKDVTYKFYETIPRPFGTQVDLFAWADIFIAPHGAAMVNTIFMKKGADIIEIWKFCLHNVASGPKKPREWTGWHAGLYGLNLTYVQSHKSELPFKKPEELFLTQGPETNGTHKVREEDVMSVFYEALERQKEIMRQEKERKIQVLGLLNPNILRLLDNKEMLKHHVRNTMRITFMLIAFFSVAIGLRRLTSRRVETKRL